MRLIASGRLDPTMFATHRFRLDETEQAYDMFADAAHTQALKVVLYGRAAGRRRRWRPARPCSWRADLAPSGLH